MDVSALRMWLLIVTGWLDRREREMLAYLIEENRVLRRQIGERRLRLLMTTAGNSPRERIDWVARRCGRSRRLSRRTRCSAGTGSWWRASGRSRGNQPPPAVSSPKFDNSWSAWPARIRPGVTREFKAR